ncbi:Ethanolamine-phosphate cytidylyltransferase [Vigna angularis]|uniref:ethanolamine-phosphate cytidylyltransferase n=1 Tax=Phaseolus angularis TaxID=3914 RepID=A0A8T0KVW0_PHAAN|nr:Ethanolamine-phosphate cytidylyltransferase [Vigna angularis]
MSSYEAVTEKPATGTKWVVTCMVGGVIVGVSLLGAYSSQLGMFWKSRRRNKKPVRVYMDGCFDMMHYGHCNALRQARALGDQLIVGVVSDAEIIANKGPPVTPLHESNLLDGALPEALDVERNVRGPFFKTLVKVFTVDFLIDASYYSRLMMVNAVKWVDEVIPEAPYAITEEFMKKLFDEYKIDFIIHGDDPCVLPDGTDAYAHAKKAGRYKQIKRTEGVSSTDIVGRMLLCVRERSISDSHNHSSLQRQFSNGHSPKFEAGSPAATASGTRISHFLPTSRRIVQFSNGRGPGPDSRIVYIDGAFDLFHAGHVEILRLARDLGDFLLVGIHTDQTMTGGGRAGGCHGATLVKLHCHGARVTMVYVKSAKSFSAMGDFVLKLLGVIHATRGSHRPIMNLHERSLSVLACRYVDEVIIGAPWEVSKDMITTFNISIVVHGTVAENNDFEKEQCNPYAVPISMGIFKVLESPLGITTTTIIKRIVSNHEAYQKRNEKKGESEKRYYEGKGHVSGD